MSGKNSLGFYFEVGENIKKRRKELGISQIQLAELTGIGYRTIQKYESNEVNQKISTLKVIASALDCDFERFLDKPKDYGQLKEMANKYSILVNALNDYIKLLHTITVDAEKLSEKTKMFFVKLKDFYENETAQ